MLWIVTKDNASHCIISCNIHEKDGMYQLWVTRANDKSLKLDESAKLEDITIIKEAIDFAIETGERVLRLH